MAVHIVDEPGLDAMAKIRAVVVLRWDSTAKRIQLSKAQKILRHHEKPEESLRVLLPLVGRNWRVRHVEGEL